MVVSNRLAALEKRLAAAQFAGEKVDALNALADHLIEIDTRRALTAVQDALDLAQSQYYPAGHALSLALLSRIQFRLGHFEDSIRFALEALRFAEEKHFKSIEVRALISLGNNHGTIGDHDMALEYYYRAWKLSEELGDSERIASLASNIGLIHVDTAEYDKASLYLQQSLTLNQQLNPYGRQVGIALLNLAYYYNTLGDPQKALQYARKSMAIAQDSQTWTVVGIALMNMGRAYGTMREYRRALRYYERSLNVFKENQAQYEEAVCYRRIANLFIEQAMPERALPFLEHSLELFTLQEAKPDIFEVHQLFSAAYESQGDLKQALAHYRIYHLMKEQVHTEKVDRRFKTLQLTHEIEAVRLEAQAALNKNKTLQQEIERREQFITDLNAYSDLVAHDLKNPISLLTGYTDLLVSDYADQVPEHVQTHLKTIHTVAGRMHAIVDGLLDLAKMQQSEIVPQALDMQPIFESARERLLPLADQHGAIITVTTPLPTVLGYASYLEEVWVNYLSNAIKYGGKPPRIQVGALCLEGDKVRFWVQDNGDGIPRDDQRKLFRRFARLETEKADGYGLGLALVRHILEKLGGHVAVESEGKPGKGSIFSFTLPLAEQLLTTPEIDA
jgi:signal transduction histidine kinase